MYWYLNGRHLNGVATEDLRDGKNIIIWGLSKRNKALYGEVDRDYVQCVFEPDEKKWGTTDDGVPICKPVPGEDAVIVSSIYDWSAVTKQAAELGYQKVYFFVLDDRGAETGKYLDMFMPLREENRIPSDKAYKYIHVIPDQKFFAPVVEMIEYGLNMDEHFFFVYDMFRTKDNASYDSWELYSEMMWKYRNVYLLHNIRPLFLDNWDQTNRENLDRLLEGAEKIIFHSFFKSSAGRFDYWKDKETLIQEKGVYISWTSRTELEPEILQYMNEAIRHVRLVATSSGVGWKRFAEKYPEFREKKLLSNGVSYARLTKKADKKKLSKNILVAHSATVHTNAIETLDRLKDIDESVKLYCVTSYGSEAAKIEAYGKNLFGDRFIPVKEYMSYEQYVEFLSGMDTAVFGMDFSGGRDTIELLFWLGAKVYLKPETTISQWLKTRGYRVEDYYRTEDQSVEELFNNPNEEWNRAVAADEFDPDIKVKQWRELYEYDFENGINNRDNDPVQ